MRPDDTRDGTAGKALTRALAIALVAILVVIACLLLADEGPNGTKIAGRLGAAAAAVLALLVYQGMERRRRRTEKDFAGKPWMRKAEPARDAEPAEPARDATPQAPAPAQTRQGGGADLDGMLAHADDALLALRDLVLHGDPEDYGMLPSLLRRAGLLDWEGPAPVSATKLRRNGRWWLTLRTDEPLSENVYDRLTTLEAVLNVNDDLTRKEWPEKATPAWRLMRTLSDVADLTPASCDRPLVTDLLDRAEKDGEWSCRLRFADSVENLPAPFRIEMAFQVNLAQGLLGVDVVVPRPGCLSFAGVRSQAAWARAYALRVALLLGRRGFASSERVGRVVVNCREHGSDDVLMSLDLTREALERLRAAARSPKVVDEGLPEDPALRFSLDAAGWLRAVEPFLPLADEELSPAARRRLPELDDTPCDEALARACGARRICDLGIMEKAGRAEAWNAVVGELGDTTQGAVARLMALRDATDDLTVAEACERASKALVDGAVDVSDLPALAALFVDGGTLGAVARSARATLEGDATPEQLEQVVGALERELSPIAETGLYLDDGDSVYRYFNSVAERVSYNLEADDAGRRVRLVPDEYYAAHSYASRALTMLGRLPEAIAHADELMRVAPATPDAALAKVRCLEEQSRIFEAADLLKHTIEICPSARELAICFYRLAFMEWKLGRSDLAVACYQRAIALHEDIAGQAKSELSDLLEAGGEGLRALDDDEVVPALERGEIPAGDLGELRARAGDAAGACVDAGLFSVARPLMGAYLELGRDDALLDVYRSLARP